MSNQQLYHNNQPVWVEDWYNQGQNGPAGVVTDGSSFDGQYSYSDQYGISGNGNYDGNGGNVTIDWSVLNELAELLKYYEAQGSWWIIVPDYSGSDSPLYPSPSPTSSSSSLTLPAEQTFSAAICVPAPPAPSVSPSADWVNGFAPPLPTTTIDPALLNPAPVPPPPTTLPHSLGWVDGAASTPPTPPTLPSLPPSSSAGPSQPAKKRGRPPNPKPVLPPAFGSAPLVNRGAPPPATIRPTWTVVDRRPKRTREEMQADAQRW